MSILQSIRNPKFTHLDDAEVSQLYIDKSHERTALIARADAGDDNAWDEVDALDSVLFSIDEELCARNLDLPNIK
jgi:hypothetical protein